MLLCTASLSHESTASLSNTAPLAGAGPACSSVLSGMIAAAIVTSTCLVAIAGKRWLGTARH